MIGKPVDRGRDSWTQSEAVEQRHAHEFRKVPRPEPHPKPGVPHGFKHHGRQSARYRTVTEQDFQSSG
jgi:hypothetical protein